MKQKNTKIKARLVGFWRQTFGSSVWVFLVPALSVIFCIIAWLTLALNTEIRRVVSNVIMEIPMPLGEASVVLLTIPFLTVGVFLYFWIDYHQQVRLLKRDNGTLTYGIIHHAQKVVIPKIRYNWGQLFYWVAYGLTVLSIIALIISTHIGSAFATGPYSGPHGSDVFAMLVKTDNQGNSNSNQFVSDMVLAGSAGWTANMNFNVDCDNDGDWEFTNHNNGFTCTYPVAGTYTVVISGTLTRVHFEDYWWNDAKKIIEIQQWGNTPWEYMYLGGANNMHISATDTPNLSSGTNLSGSFSGNDTFNSNINNWDISNVVGLGGMFRGATSFNQPLDNWNTTGVAYMNYMFTGATAFNQPLNTWDTSSVTDMSGMFSGATSFNQPLNSWDTSSVTDMNGMFGSGDYPSYGSGATSFNQPLNNWDTSSVVNMDRMFASASSFNQSLSTWDTSSVTDMSGMFSGATSFNQPLNTWNTSSVTDFVGSNYWDELGMFAGATSFNQPLNNWNTSSALSMKGMFSGATSFNENITTWNTSSVTDMSRMFSGATSFNQNINSWDTSSVTNMSEMFGSWSYRSGGSGATSFNQPLKNWNTSGVTNMSEMFAGATSFNQPLNNWNTSGVTSMSGMFAGATSFNENITTWNTGNVINMSFGGSNPGTFEDATSFLAISFKYSIGSGGFSTAPLELPTGGSLGLTEIMGSGGL